MIKISVLDANREVQNYSFENKTEISIGRSTSCDVCINDGHISRNHLDVTLREDKIFIKDVTLSNWVSYNDEKLSKSEETLYFDFAALVLPGGFEVRIGLERRVNSLREKIEASSQNPKTTKRVVKSKARVVAREKRQIYLLILIIAMALGYYFMDTLIPTN